MLRKSAVNINPKPKWHFNMSEEKPKHFIVYGHGVSMSLIENIAATNTTATEIPTSQGLYPAGRPFVEFWPKVAGYGEEEITANLAGIKNSVVTIVQSVGKPYADNFTFAKLAANNAKRFGARIVHMVFPFLDLREDKEYSDRGTSFANPIDARELAAAGADFVTFMAPHSKAGVEQYKQVFGRNISIVEMPEIIIPILKERFKDKIPTLVNGAPDGWNKPGDQAFQCAIDIATALHGDGEHSPHLFGIEKIRSDVGVSRAVSFHGNVGGKIALSADDMFDGGGTSIHAAEEADAHGAAETYTIAAHGLFSKTLAPFLAARNKAGGLLINQVITTNTLPVERSIEEVRRQFPNIKDRIHVADVSSFVNREIIRVLDQAEHIAREARNIERPGNGTFKRQ